MPAMTAVLAFALVAMIATSAARFSGVTSNTNNQIVAGRVDIDLDSDPTPLIHALNVDPGTTAVGCVVLHYVGDIVPAAVRLTIVQPVDNALDGVDLTIESGETCSAASGLRHFEGPMDELWLATSWATGIDVWSPTSTGDTVAVLTTVRVHEDANPGSVTFSARWHVRPGGGT